MIDQWNKFPKIKLGNEKWTSNKHAQKLLTMVQSNKKTKELVEFEATNGQVSYLEKEHANVKFPLRRGSGIRCFIKRQSGTAINPISYRRSMRHGLRVHWEIFYVHWRDRQCLQNMI